MKRSILPILLILIAVTAGCSREPAGPPAPVQRWAHQRLAEDARPGFDTPDVDASWSARYASAAENTQDGLRLTWGGRPAEMTLEGSINARDFSAFVVRMRIEPGQSAPPAETSPEAVLRWKTRLEPEFREETGRRVPVFADGAFHTYQIPLWSSTGSTWVGEVTALEFVPCDVAADVQIQSMELLNEPARTPTRVTIGFQTHEAVFGAQPPWTLRVPENSAFEAYVGLAPLSWDRESGDGVEFQLAIEAGGQEPEIVARETFDAIANESDRVWRRIEADLSDYAGERVTLHFDVDRRATSDGDYAYWGNPMVFARAAATEDVPIILISNDTLRADRLGCYGHDRETSPNIDAFRNDAVLFENATCPVSWTLPSHMTMLTGLRPQNHKVSHTVNLREEVVTLPEMLRTAGYITAAFTGVDGYMSADYGFPHGFDIYNTPDAFRPIEVTQPLALDWLATPPADAAFSSTTTSTSIRNRRSPKPTTRISSFPTTRRRANNATSPRRCPSPNCSDSKTRTRPSARRFSSPPPSNKFASTGKRSVTCAPYTMTAFATSIVIWARSSTNCGAAASTSAR